MVDARLNFETYTSRIPYQIYDICHFMPLIYLK